MNGALASHYARALADWVLSPESDLQPQQALDQLYSIEYALSSSDDLQLVLRSPTVSKGDKFMLAERLAEELALHRTIRNFMLLVVTHGRTHEIGRMVAEFDRVIDERRGIVPAKVFSARELSHQERETVERALSSNLGRPTRARYEVDSSLLGGIRAIVDSKEYDASLRGRLERLRTELFSHI
jgi:F-type H+-transporting ATPase subunit delta